MNIARYYKGLGLMVAATAGLMLTSCKDEPDKYEVAGGLPTVNYIRCMSSEVKGNNDAADTHYTTGELVESASPQSTLALIGSNLRSVYEIWFNDKKAILNTSYITDNTLLVDVPKSVPRKVTDKIYLVTQAKDTVKVDFKVVIPAPDIKTMTCEYAAIGDKVTFSGNYFVYDPNVPLTAFFTGTDGEQIPVTIDESDVAEDFTSVDVTIPEGAGRGPVTFTSIYGTAQSPFYYLDNRGMLFDFEDVADGGTGLFSQGWKVRDRIEDEFSLTGCRHYITIGDGVAVMAEDGAWQDVPFRFDYWCGSWDTPQNITTPPGAALFNVADFSKWESMALKFEMNIPSSNAWAAAAMQVCFQPIEQVTLSGNPVAGYKEVGTANHAAFDGSGDKESKWGIGDWGRAFYRPWMTTGEFHTDGKWITVTIPLADLTLDKDGKPASIGPKKATDFASLTLFLMGGGTGKECSPLLRIDNIRVVPYK
ncbi:MAG: hypothetical protein J6O23_09095 [Prevotella sp.]|nr:hypothetical protein [Prevotella sp.]